MVKPRPFLFYVGWDPGLHRWAGPNPPLVAIVHEDYWHANHRLEDCHIRAKYGLQFGLAGFAETMDSVFEGPAGLSADELRQLLIGRGFRQDPEFDLFMRDGWYDSIEDMLRAMEGE